MSLRLMKERMAQSGMTPREELVRDGQIALSEELEHDVSYSPTMCIWKYNSSTGFDDRVANVRIFARGYSSLNGNYQEFLTTHDNPIYIGDYLHDTKDDTFWLVQESFNVDDIHYQGKMIQCNYLLRWVTSDNRIVERWSNIVSASKYDNGETGTSTITVGSNNFTVLVGYCDEGFDLEGQRVFIDKRTKNPTKVFKMTRGDDVLYDSGNMGALFSYIADKTEFNPKEDNQELRVCNYHSPTHRLPKKDDKMTNLSAVISGGNVLRRSRKKTWCVKFFGADKDEIANRDFKWNVVADFDVGQVVTDNKIQLRVDDESCVDSSFLLQVIVDDTVLTENKINIIDAF